jgi:hypothetical protein
LTIGQSTLRAEKRQNSPNIAPIRQASDHILPSDSLRPRGKTQGFARVDVGPRSNVQNVIASSETTCDNKSQTPPAQNPLDPERHAVLHFDCSESGAKLSQQKNLGRRKNSHRPRQLITSSWSEANRISRSS